MNRVSNTSYQLVTFFVSVFSIALILSSCGNSPATNNSFSQEDYIEPLNIFPQLSIEDIYSKVGITDSLTISDDSAKSYLAHYYWDNFLSDKRLIRLNSQNFSDVLGVTDKIFADAFLDYIILLQSLDDIDIKQSYFSSLLDRAEYMAQKGSSEFLNILIACSEKVLYDPHSPYMDDELYIIVLEKIRESKVLSKDVKFVYSEQYKFVSKNRVGAIAPDWEFGYKIKNEDGKTVASTPYRRLHNISERYTLLLFTDPACSHCKHGIEQLKSSSVILQMTKRKELKIVCIYSEGNLEMLQSYINQNIFPKDWIVGYNPSGAFNVSDPFILRTIPSIYLLDNEKRIVLKDASLPKVFEYLERVQGSSI